MGDKSFKRLQYVKYCKSQYHGHRQIVKSIDDAPFHRARLFDHDVPRLFLRLVSLPGPLVINDRASGFFRKSDIGQQLFA